MRRFGAMLGLSLVAHAAAFAAVTAGVVGGRSSEAERPVAPPVLTGDTIEVPGLESASASAEDDTTFETAEPTAPVTGGDTQTRAARPRRPKTVIHGATGEPSPESASGDGEPVRFGAVGERGAVDLVMAFTRGFPQAASSDPIWTHAPLGSAGTIDVVLQIDESGHLVSANLEPGGTPALRQGLSRTIALIRGRTFTARRQTTRLRVTGIVSPDAIKHGGSAVYGLDMGQTGKPSFSLAVGRRIELNVTER